MRTQLPSVFASMMAGTPRTERGPAMRAGRYVGIGWVAPVLIMGGGFSAFRAYSYASCVGFIDVPTLIPRPGTWCLRQNLGTSITSGAAIWVNADYVTIDCNGFALDNLEAGSRTGATGVLSYRYSGITVRNCAIRGFA